MSKIIIENIREKAGKVRLHAFIDNVRVGPVDQDTSLEIDDVAPGDYLLHVGLNAKKPRGTGVPFRLADGETKRIQVNLTDWALLAAKWHEWLMIVGLVALLYVVIDFLLGFVGYQLVKGKYYFYTAATILPVASVIYPLVELWHKKTPRNFVKILTPPLPQ